MNIYPVDFWGVDFLGCLVPSDLLFPEVFQYGGRSVGIKYLVQKHSLANFLFEKL